MADLKSKSNKLTSTDILLSGDILGVMARIFCKPSSVNAIVKLELEVLNLAIKCTRTDITGAILRC